jgi:hypothetical protein
MCKQPKNILDFNFYRHNYKLLSYQRNILLLSENDLKNSLFRSLRVLDKAELQVTWLAGDFQREMEDTSISGAR